jgi:hypothetical protein
MVWLKRLWKESLKLEAIIPQRLKPNSLQAFTYGLKAVPFRKMSFSAGSKVVP